jgi:hypothetical protein
MFKARNREFFRDRAAFGWNFMFPFLIVAGFGVIFGGKSYTEYNVGLFPHKTVAVTPADSPIPDGFRKMRYIKFIGISTRAEGLNKLKHHKIDFLLKLDGPPYEYYVSDASPKGYVLEQMLPGLVVSRDSGDEHDVQRSLGGGVRRGAISQKRGLEALEGHAAERL